MRINPWELHIRDPAFFNQFYTCSSKLDKDPWYYNFAGIPRSTFATSPAAIHRQRRGAISKAFTSSPETSKKIEECVGRLLDRLQCLLRDSSAEPVRMSNLYWMFASDVVTRCMMPRSTEYVTHPGSAPHYARMFKTLAKVALWNRHFSMGFTLLASLPRCILNHTAAPFVQLLKMQDVSVVYLPPPPMVDRFFRDLLPRSNSPPRSPWGLPMANRLSFQLSSLNQSSLSRTNPPFACSRKST